jgi:hypothetical protein
MLPVAGILSCAAKNCGDIEFDDSADRIRAKSLSPIWLPPPGITAETEH